MKLQSKMRQLALLVVITLCVALSATSALANTAANAQIVNNARLTFTGGSASASVIVTVNLVPSTPNVVINNATGAYTSVNNVPLTDSVIITSTANGPASYTVTPTVSANTNDTAPSVNIAGAANTTVSIAASVTSTLGSTTYLIVPASGQTGDDNVPVNGINVGTRIAFNVSGTIYTVDVTATHKMGDGTYKISWGSAIGVAVPAGTQVGEVKTVNVTVLPGAITSLGTPIDVTVQAVVSTASAADRTVTNASPNVWTSTPANVTMNKYVRNITSGATGTTSATFTINGVSHTYYQSGITGKTDDVLEYVVQVANATGASDLTTCTIADAIPTDYATFVFGPYGGANQDVWYIDTAGVGHNLQAGSAGTTQASYITPNFVINVGDGANSTTPGTIPGDKNVVVSYQVKIK